MGWSALAGCHLEWFWLFMAVLETGDWCDPLPVLVSKLIRAAMHSCYLMSRLMSILWSRGGTERTFGCKIQCRAASRQFSAAEMGNRYELATVTWYERATFSKRYNVVETWATHIRCY